MSPECQNCGSFVTSRYVRVFTPNDVDAPRVCPWCEDKVRDGAGVRDSRSQRRSDRSDKHASYDPQVDSPVIADGGDHE